MRSLAYLGKLSYGIYLWHFPVTRMAQEWKWGWPATAAAALAFSIAMSALSYHTIEAFVRQRRNLPRKDPLQASSPAG
jgi:peptidoglycan/LPS O-acetylase OafA/YrhL